MFIRKLLFLCYAVTVFCGLSGCATSIAGKGSDADSLAELLKRSGTAYADGRCQDAIDGYLAVIALVPTDIDSMLKIAKCSVMLGDQDLAASQYRNIIRLQPDNRPANYNLLYLQLSNLFTTVDNVAENVPPSTPDEAALAELAIKLLTVFRTSSSDLSKTKAAASAQ